MCEEGILTAYFPKVQLNIETGETDPCQQFVQKCSVYVGVYKVCYIISILIRLQVI